MTQDRIIIAGGGIGGPATAIGLAQKGVRSLVQEKSADLDEVGAGIQLAPTAVQAFDTLGVGDAARAMAVQIDNLRLMDALGGQEITRIPLDDACRARSRTPCAVVHRGDLHRVFLRACGDHDLVDLRSSAAGEDYEEEASKVTAILSGGDHIYHAAGAHPELRIAETSAQPGRKV